MIQNIINTTNQNFWQDGQSFEAPYGDPGEPIINTQQVGFWQDGQIFLFPFQNTSSGTTPKMPMQLMMTSIIGIR